MENSDSRLDPNMSKALRERFGRLEDMVFCRALYTMATHTPFELLADDYGPKNRSNAAKALWFVEVCADADDLPRLTVFVI